MTTISARVRPFHFTDEQAGAIKGELDSILSSAHFAGSKRCCEFLEFIVLHALEGDLEKLNERFLGTELFGRPVDYETATDAIVRVRANDVRRRLAEFYSESQSHSKVKIAVNSGTYIPEFQWRGSDIPEPTQPIPFDPLSNLPKPNPAGGGALAVADDPRTRRWTSGKLLLWIAIAAAVAIVAILGWRQRYRAAQPQSALDDFWRPVLRDQHTVIICPGGNVFDPQTPSGTLTASKYNDYPWVSMQIASAIAKVSVLLDHSGATSQLESSAFTSITDLREHPVTLLGAYNNPWTLRLVDPLRFHLNPRPDEFFVDRLNPQVRWARDSSQPYSSADDFSLIARFRDATTGDWVVVLAGLGRNGTEAAADFATSPHYMQLLRDRLGRGFANRGVEAILRVKVVDGKTGAPSIVAVYDW